MLHLPANLYVCRSCSTSKRVFTSRRTIVLGSCGGVLSMRSGFVWGVEARFVFQSCSRVVLGRTSASLRTEFPIGKQYPSPQQRYGFWVAVQEFK